MKKLLIVIMVIILAFVCLGASEPQDFFTVEIDVGGALIKYTDEHYVADNHLIYEEIRDRKINAPLSDKKREVMRLIEEGISEKEAVLRCFPSIKKTFDLVCKKVHRNPIDSTIKFCPEKEVMFSLTKEKVGKDIDEQAFYSDIVYALFFGKQRIKIKTVNVEPGITIEDNKAYLYCKSVYTTSMELSSQNRKHNIEKALSAINGTVLRQSETMSFNTKTGIRSEENGYKNAKIIVGNEYVDGVGGGVCQASTTLYNSALLAGLEVLTVSSHSLLPSYVEPGFDAMVNTGSSDLVIKNCTGGPIFIKAFVKNGKATVVIYGKKNEYEIRKKSVTVYKGDLPDDRIVYDRENKYFSPDETLQQKRVSYSQPQLKSESYLLYYKDGKMVKEIKIREDKYNSKRGIIAYRVENAKGTLFFYNNIHYWS